MGLPSHITKPLALPDAAPSRPANPFEVASTIPHLTPFAAPAPAAPSGAIEVVVDPMRIVDTDAAHEDAAPSRQDLLQRAAELGPGRMTWENIVLAPTDPILGEKMQPRVAERRARFRKIVKVAVGACVAFCLAAAAVTTLSSSASDVRASGAASISKTAPAVGVVPVEKLELATRTKAPSHVTAAARPTPAPKFAKRR